MRIEATYNKCLKINTTFSAHFTFIEKYMEQNDGGRGSILTICTGQLYLVWRNNMGIGLMWERYCQYFVYGVCALSSIYEASSVREWHAL